MTFLSFSSAKRETRRNDQYGIMPLSNRPRALPVRVQMPDERKRSRAEVVHTTIGLLDPSTNWDKEMATPLSRPSLPGPGPSRTRKRVSQSLGEDTLKTSARSSSVARDRMVFLNRSNDLSRSHRSILPVYNEQSIEIFLFLFDRMYNPEFVFLPDLLHINVQQTRITLRTLVYSPPPSSPPKSPPSPPSSP